ncbi:hypothetical protein MMEU_1902 [Mycobacterium marinum str. Europe]|nr:hypothetical protein MMEU_1902 [Mycobacterium marinum str. Europe]
MVAVLSVEPTPASSDAAPATSSGTAITYDTGNLPTASTDYPTGARQHLCWAKSTTMGMRNAVFPPN